MVVAFPLDARLGIMLPFVPYGDLDDTQWETLQDTQIYFVVGTGQQIIDTGAYPFTPSDTVDDYKITVFWFKSVADGIYTQTIRVTRDGDVLNDDAFSRSGETFAAMVGSGWSPEDVQGIDDVLARNQALKANRTIDAGAFNLAIEGTLDVIGGFEAEVTLFSNTAKVSNAAVVAELSASNGTDTSSIQAFTNGRVRWNSSTLDYEWGDGAGANLPAVDSDAAAHIATIIDATGFTATADYLAFRSLRASGAPVDGTTVAWFVGQLYLDSSDSNREYVATSKSTDPDSAGTGSVWGATSAVIEGIDDVLAVGQQFTANRTIDTGAFTLLFTGAGGFIGEASSGSNASGVSFVTTVAELESTDGVETAKIQTFSNGTVRFTSSVPGYQWGDGGGDDLPTINSDAVAHIATIIDATGFTARADYDAFRSLRASGAPGNGTTTAWFEGQSYTDSADNGQYVATTASTNPDTAPTGSVWAFIPDENIYNTDGSYTATTRLFEGENVSSLTIRMMDLIDSTFTARSQTVQSSTQNFMGFQVGAGGSVDFQSAINITASGMTVQDTINNAGFSNAADYSAVNAFNDRWLTDKRYVDQVLSSSKIQTIRLKSDLPDPVSGVITSPLNTNLYFIESVDLGTDRLVIAAGGSITGIRNSAGGQTILSGTTSDPLITINAQGTYLDVQFQQDGTGDVVDFDPGATPFQNLICRRVNFVGGALRMQNSAFAIPLFNCNFDSGASIIVDANCAGNFVGLLDASLVSDSAPGDVLLLLESGATLTRIQVAGSAFVQANASTAILIEDGAATSVGFLDLLNAGFNIFSADAVALQCDDPDAITMGLMTDTQFSDTGTALRCVPTVDSTLTQTDTGVATDCTILNGNMILSDFTANQGFDSYVGISDTFDTNFPVTGNLRGITNDGFNIIINNQTGSLFTVMDGLSNTPSFSFAAPGTATRGLAFDGEDVWTVDDTTDMVFQMTGKTATVKNMFALQDGELLGNGIAVDGTVVLVSGRTNFNIQVYTPTGTLLYDFPSPDGAGRIGLGHQEDQWIACDFNSTDVYVYDKNIPFHQGSKTWKMEDNSITDSATRIVTRFRSDAGVQITPVQNVFRPISNGGDLVWGAAAEGFEKFLVTDPITGLTKYIGSREMPAMVSAGTRFARTTGAAVDLEVGLFLNNTLISASVFAVTLDTGDIFNLTYPSFILRLAPDDELILQFQNTSSNVAIEFFGGVISLG